MHRFIYEKIKSKKNKHYYIIKSLQVLFFSNFNTSVLEDILSA